MSSSTPPIRSRAALHVLATPARPARPPHIPARRLPRRPGDRREPLLIPRLPAAVSDQAAGRGLELGCAVELCLERALVLRDLEVLLLATLYPRLLALAADARVRCALPPAKARYLQVLLAARERQTDPLDNAGEHTDAILDIPLRLFPRVVDVVLSADVGAQALDEALCLEIAALSDGRTMSEWVALTALTLTR